MAEPARGTARIRRPGRRHSRREPGLDTPRDTRRRLVPTPSVDPETFGRLSERIARFMGTARFLLYMTVFVVGWLVWNNVAPPELRFDRYTHTFLTLLLSIQASYAAPLILLAQNRQADRDRVTFEQDRQRSERLLADSEYLSREVQSLRIALREVATRDFLRSELRGLLDELDERDRADPATAQEGGDRTG